MPKVMEDGRLTDSHRVQHPKNPNKPRKDYEEDGEFI